MEVDYDFDKKFLVLTPLLTRNGEQYAYFNMEMKTENLMNQSVNYHLVGLNEKNEAIFQRICYPTGLTGTTDWIKMPALIELSPSINSYTFAIAIYRNGQQPSKENGFIYIKNPNFTPAK